MRNANKSKIPYSAMVRMWKSDPEFISRRTGLPPRVNQFVSSAKPIITSSFNEIGWLLLQLTEWQTNEQHWSHNLRGGGKKFFQQIDEVLEAATTSVWTNWTANQLTNVTYSLLHCSLAAFTTTHFTKLQTDRYTVSQKNAPTSASCSFDKYGPILIIFGQQHQHAFRNDMHIQLSVSLCFYLLYLHLNSCSRTDAKQHVSSVDWWWLWKEPVV